MSESQPFCVLVSEQTEEGKPGKLITVDDTGKPAPRYVSMNGPTLKARVEAVEKAVIAQLAIEQKYDPNADRVPIVWLLPFERPAELTAKKTSC